MQVSAKNTAFMQVSAQSVYVASWAALNDLSLKHDLCVAAKYWNEKERKWTILYAIHVEYILFVILSQYIIQNTSVDFKKINWLPTFLSLNSKIA